MQIDTHAIIPLTPTNQPYYEQLDAAKRELCSVEDLDRKVKLWLAIGDASSHILRIKRDETENAAAKAARLEAENKALRAKLDELRGLAGGDNAD